MLLFFQARSNDYTDIWRQGMLLTFIFVFCFCLLVCLFLRLQYWCSQTIGRYDIRTGEQPDVPILKFWVLYMPVNTNNVSQ